MDESGFGSGSGWGGVGHDRLGSWVGGRRTKAGRCMGWWLK